jgi:hypothetical protein
MAEFQERTCVGCGDTDAMARLEPCSICRRAFCADCAHKAAFGRKFCSADCARAYYFTGEPDDDDDDDKDLHDD